MSRRPIRIARASLSAALVLIFVGGNMCVAAKLEVKQVGGQAEIGTVEIHGVGAGEFRPELWEKGTLNIVPDARLPLIEPRRHGLWRNIYAPSAVETPDGWRVFYGAWDGVDSGNDRIYSTSTRDFLDFTDRAMVIDHGEFIHCCNVSAARLPTGEYRLMCTVYPDKSDRNKPATFTSADGVKWNGADAPYPAKMDDIISIDGYDKFADADINGMNVILYEDGVWRLYFNNFKDFGKVYRASSTDGKHFRLDGQAVEFGACVNDVKKLSAGKDTYYLMGLHMNTDKLWYSLSKDGLTFGAPREMVKNLGEKDRYIVAVGWVVKGNRVLGFLYGAGEASHLAANRIWGRWLQKKVVFVASDGTRYEGSRAIGPDRQVIDVPKDKPLTGHFVVYDEDGTTPIVMKSRTTLTSSAVYVLEEAK